MRIDPSSGNEQENEWLYALGNGDRSVIPKLQTLFDESILPSQKGLLASVLLASGVRDEKYLDYVASEARAAIESDIPSPLVFDPSGQIIQRKRSAAYLDWCKRHRVDPEKFAYEAFYGRAQKLFDLAASGDPRGFDLLMKALKSDNGVLSIIAAKGLAKIQDPRAIDPMIGECNRAPAKAGGAIGIASALIYFNDNKARTAARECLNRGNFDCPKDDSSTNQSPTKRCLSPEKIYQSLLADAQKRGVKGLFGY